jgi:cyclophilin family peptidyl-prolyl cis-trans isomerase/HEAT repeat protein
MNPRSAKAAGLCLLSALGQLCVLSSSAVAQTRLAVLQAEDRRASTAADLATLRAGAHSRDPEIARIAVRALGRLERPALIPDILPLLRHAVAEVRAEAANAIGQAAQGWGREKGVEAADLATLVARLKIEGDTDVRAAIAETIGRLPYHDRQQADKAGSALTDFDSRAESVTDRLGVAKGLEALIRLNRKLPDFRGTDPGVIRGRDPGVIRGRDPGVIKDPPPDTIATLERYVIPRGAEASSGARVRRLALEGLLSAHATGGPDGLADLAAKAAADPDAQVRRLATRAAPLSVLMASTHDVSPNVRLEALGQLKARGAQEMCAASLEAVSDRDTQVALVALDQLSGCGAMDGAIDTLDHAVNDLSEAAQPRGWHRAAHAIVALAAASPDRAAQSLGQFIASRIWQLRMYAARAATALANREALEKLAIDEEDNVREVAIGGLRAAFGHAADSLFVVQLTRPGYHVVRAAAIALADTPNREAAIPALRVAHDRLAAEGRDNSHDARAAIEKALASLGEKIKATDAIRSAGPGARPRTDPRASDLNADDLRRLASPRAHVTVRGVGAFDLALFTAQAPATVLRFARLAESGYYNGLTFHRVAPNFVIQGGSPGANEYVGDARFMRDELGLWPHVRGAVGISTRGRDTGDAQIFVDLVDNPRLDHEYTVFAQVLNGIDVVDRILEGDIIERIDIIPGS